MWAKGNGGIAAFKRRRGRWRSDHCVMEVGGEGREQRFPSGGECGEWDADSRFVPPDGGHVCCIVTRDR